MFYDIKCTDFEFYLINTIFKKKLNEYLKAK